MPVLNPNNHGGTIRDNTQIRQPGESGLIQPQEEEQRIADAVLQDRLELVYINCIYTSCINQIVISTNCFLLIINNS